jgi:hypothetical protein
VKSIPDTLLAIADEIEQHPERWTQAAYAKNARGDSVWANDPKATCWCTLGFIERDLGGLARCELSVEIDNYLGKPIVPIWNDAPERKPEDVVTMFRGFAATWTRNPA